MQFGELTGTLGDVLEKVSAYFDNANLMFFKYVRRTGIKRGVVSDIDEMRFMRCYWT